MAHHGNVFRHAHAALVQRLQRAHGKPVGLGKNAVEVEPRVQRRRYGVVARGKVCRGRVDHALLVQGHAQARKLLRKAARAHLRHGKARRRRQHHRARTARARKLACGKPSAGHVVAHHGADVGAKAALGHLAVDVERRHVATHGRAHVLQAVCAHDARHALRRERCVALALHVRVVVGVVDHDGEPRRKQPRLQRHDHAREELVADVGHDYAHGVRALLAQAARQLVGLVVQALDRLAHARLRLGGKPAVVVDHARHRRDGDARGTGHLPHRHARISHASSPPARHRAATPPW